MAEPDPRRRKRPTASCTLCKKRKIKCDRALPCGNCVRSRGGICVYDGVPAARRRAPHPAPAHSQGDGPASASVPSTPSTAAAAGEVDALRGRVRVLEERLARAELRTPVRSGSPGGAGSVFETTTSGITGSYHLNRVHEGRGDGRAQFVTRSIMHKSRLLGQSHWANSLVMLRDVFEMLEPFVRTGTTRASLGLQRCKALAHVVKAARTPAWPAPPTPDLPPRALADALLENYLRTSERVYRVLHVPSFRREWAALWAPGGGGNGGERSAAFLVQAKLVLAIGAATHDETFSLRASATRWVYEAQTWLAAPEAKAHLSLPALQTSLLLLIARETTSVCEGLVFVSAGAVLRTAVYMGLHRDPARLPKATRLVAELRRRLWNTLLELVLQSSLSAGAPPLVSLDDFDAKAPPNFDDEQLDEEDPVPKPMETFTQTSVAIALRQTFPHRLATTKFLNDLGSGGTYEEALRLDAEMRASYKALRQTLLARRDSAAPSPSQFDIRVVDVIMNRWLSALHIPFFGLALNEAAYAFSRRATIETSLKIWYATCPASSNSAAAPRTGDAETAERDDLQRLSICGSGFFRAVAREASFLIAFELRAQLEEEDSLGPVPFRRDLLSVLEEAKTWSLRCIKAGETNVKGYLLASLVVAQIHGLMQGAKDEEVPALLIKAMEEAEDECVPALELQASHGQDEEYADRVDEMALNLPAELIEDWGFMNSESPLEFGNVEPMNWGFNEAI